MVKRQRTDAPDENRAVVIGIDGLSYSLIEAYMRSGVMPRMGQMAREGRLVPMKSSLPEVSSVAWTSFMTGQNPGEHGIFGFMELDERYGYRFPNYTDVRVPTFWERLKLPAVVINVPETYPAVRPLNGLLVSGFVAVDLKRAVFPGSRYDRLREMGYRLDVNARLAVENPDRFFEDLFEVFRKRAAAIRHFFDVEPWRLFVGVITETDRLHHYFHPQALGEGKYHDRILKLYGELDAFIGEMFDKAKELGAMFMTCSDHGFTTIRSEVYLNRWLVENGYLQLDDGREGLTGITGESRAFCLDPARIYLHVAGKYPKGPVRVEDTPALRNELASRLADLTFDGEKVVRRVYVNEDLFSGPYQDRGPDIYLLPNRGFDLKGAVNRTEVFGRTPLNGMHTYDDAHLFVYPKREVHQPKIEDVALLIEDGLVGTRDTVDRRRGSVNPALERGGP